MYNLDIPIRIVLTQLDEKTWSMCCFFSNEITPYYQARISDKKRKKESLIRKIAIEKLYISFTITILKV